MKIAGKVVGLGTLILTVAAMLGSPSFAAAEETALCSSEQSICSAGSTITHVHETSVGKAKLLSSLPTIECNVLFLGDALNGGMGAPLAIHGKLTYSSCNNFCIVSEVKGTETTVEVLRTASELTSVTGEGTVYVECPFISCVYNGEGLEGHGLGPLTSSQANGSVVISTQKTMAVEGSCPESAFLDITITPLTATYISKGSEKSLGPPPPKKTALCSTDEAEATCLEEHKPGTVDYKDSAAEFLSNLLNSKCEGLASGSVGAAGKPQEVKAEYKFSACTNSCAITDIAGSSELLFLLEGEASKELAAVTTEGFELFVKCGSTVKCAFGPVELHGDGLGALATKDNGHITFSKQSLSKGEGALCPSEASLDALFVASSATYIREDYFKPLTALCSKDEGTPVCKSENQLKTIDYKDKAVELLTNLINVKCEGLASGSVGSPGEPLNIAAELAYSSCSGGCFVTDVSGPGTIALEREGKAEEAKATSEGFEIFVKCGTTIKCLLGPEKMVGKALGALTTGDNGHLTFSKVSMGKGEGATCPSEATLDALFVASSAAYIG
jgi:hypothetical protein